MVVGIEASASAPKTRKQAMRFLTQVKTRYKLNPYFWQIYDN